MKKIYLIYDTGLNYAGVAGCLQLTFDTWRYRYIKKMCPHITANKIFVARVVRIEEM